MTDKRVQFTALFRQALLQKMEVQVYLSSAYHPEKDECTERMNAILEQYFYCFEIFQQDNWLDLLAVNLLITIFSMPQPFLANDRFHLRLLPLALLDSPVPAVKSFLHELTTLHQIVKCQLNKVKEDYKWFADHHHRVIPSLAVRSVLAIHPAPAYIVAVQEVGSQFLELLCYRGSHIPCGVPFETISLPVGSPRLSPIIGPGCFCQSLPSCSTTTYTCHGTRLAGI